MALAAAVVVLVRQVLITCLVIKPLLVVSVLHLQLLEHLLIMLEAGVAETALALLGQAVLVVVEMEINIVLVLTLVA
jgi:hypothetical protein